jgi:ComF family protein
MRIHSSTFLRILPKNSGGRLMLSLAVVAQRAMDMLSPPVCLGCQQVLVRIATPTRLRIPRSLICSSCQASWNREAVSICNRCALPRPTIRDIQSASEQSPSYGASRIVLRCSFCATMKFKFVQTTVLGEYRDMLQQLVLESKQTTGSTLCFSLGGLLGERILQTSVGGSTTISAESDLVEESWIQRIPDVVCSVPMHWRRRFKRKINGPDIIATGVARVVARPVNLKLLKCTRLPKKQGTLSRGQRQKNVKSSYAVNVGEARRFIGKRVLLVDDVMTSGATLNELSRLLLRNGIESVSVAAIARGGSGT